MWKDVRLVQKHLNIFGVPYEHGKLEIPIGNRKKLMGNYIKNNYIIMQNISIKTFEKIAQAIHGDQNISTVLKELTLKH